MTSAPESPRTVRAVLPAAVERLAAAGVASPRVDAELLIAHALGIPRGRLILHLDAPMPPEALVLVGRRATREPLQHLLGSAAFRTVELAVGPGVFVPRPETELLAGAALDHLRRLSVEHPLVVDLCSGSGALAAAVLAEWPGARAVAVEASADAEPWLRRNLAGCDTEILIADVRDADLDRWRAQAHVVVANPPYVPADAPVAPEVRADPPQAVFAGADGLALMGAVERAAAGVLRPGGLVAVEHDERHQEQVVGIFGGGPSAGPDWQHVTGHFDLAGRPRYVTAERR